MRNQQEEVYEKSVKEKLAEFMQLPKELVLDVPKLTGYGNNQLLIEGILGIVEYTDTVVKIKTKKGNLIIDGRSLEIKAITGDDLFIEGIIKNMTWNH